MAKLDIPVDIRDAEGFFHRQVILCAMWKFPKFPVQAPEGHLAWLGLPAGIHQEKPDSPVLILPSLAYRCKVR